MSETIDKTWGGTLPQITAVTVETALCDRFLNCTRIARGAFKIDRGTGKAMAVPGAHVDQRDLWTVGRSCPTGATRFMTDVGPVEPRWLEASQWDSSRHPADSRPRG